MTRPWLNTLLLLLLPALLAACGGGDGSGGAMPEPIARPSGTAEIGPAGGRVEGVDGASVSVPAGALEVTATVSIARDSTDAPPAPNGMRTLGGLYAVTPHGARFVQPVEVSIPFDVQALPAGRKPALLKVSPGQPWQVIENVTVNDNRITASVDSLSWFLPISVPFTGFGIVNPTVPPPSNLPSYQLSLEAGNLTLLQATGVNATLAQQQQPAEPARIRASIHVPEGSELVQTCSASSGSVRVNVNRLSAVTYRRPADPVAGTNRVALDFNVIETFFTHRALTTTPATTLLEMSAVDARWNPPPPDPYNGLLGIRTSSLPPDGIVDASAPGWQVEIQVDCMPLDPGLSWFTQPLWSLQPSVQPIVVLRGFAPARIGIAQQPVSSTLLDGQFVRLEAAAVVSRPFDNVLVSTSWERAEPGSNNWVAIAARPTGSPPPADGLYHYGAVGVPARLEGAVRATTDNGARLRARLCLPASATAAAECSTSREATLTVSSNFPAPRFTTQPRSQTMQSGQTLALFAEFSGFPVPTLVTWQTRASDTEAWLEVDRNTWRNSVRPENTNWDGWWSRLSRAEDRLVSTRTLTVADRGRQFRATYTTVAGTATSAGATINVTTGQTPPRVTAQPQGIVVGSGQTAVFAAAADGAAPLSYQWLFNGQRIPGANAPTLALGSANAGNAGLYMLEVSNVEDTVRSQAVRLTVTGNTPPPDVAPTITTAPLSQTLVAGSSATFAVVAAGTAPISYQWIRDGNFVAGATSPVLTLSNLGAGDSGSFAVLVFNAAGSITSSAATLTVQTVQPPVTQAPVITTQPTGQVLTLGQRAVFAVAVSGGAPLSYRWERDGSALQGADGAVLVIDAAGAADAGSYRVTVSNGAGSTSSSAAGLVLLPAPGAPAITAQPSGRSVVEGQAATFSLAVTGNPAPRCQWTRNNVALDGATSCAGYSTAATTNADNGALYNVVVYSPGGVAIGNGAVLTVTPPPAVPVITQDLADLTAPEGGIATFSVVASANGTLFHYWTRIGAPTTPLGASSFDIGPLQASDDGATVRVIVCNGPIANNRCTTSRDARLTVTPAVPANALTATQIVAGEEWSMVLRPDRSVWAWGSLHRADGVVQYANLNPANQAVRPVRMYPSALSDVRAISGWSSGFWALKGAPGSTGSRVLHWGRALAGSDGRGGDGNGSLGSSIAARANEAAPVEVLERVNNLPQPVDRVCAIAGGGEQLAMIRAINSTGITTDCNPGSAKTVWFVGSLLGRGHESTGVAFAMPGLPVDSPPAAIFTGKTTSGSPPLVIALEDGRLYGLGTNPYGGVGVPANGSGVVGSLSGPQLLPANWGNARSFGMSFYYSLFVVRADGSVMTSGYDGTGELGLGSVIGGSILGPLPVLAETCTSLPCTDVLTGVTSIAGTAASATLALKNGQILGWGSRGSGMLGPVVSGSQLFPRPVSSPGVSGFTALSASNRHALVIGPGNVVYAWGSNLRFALGNTQDRAEPTLVTVP